jgi:hypothetical protein
MIDQDDAEIPKVVRGQTAVSSVRGTTMSLRQPRLLNHPGLLNRSPPASVLVCALGRESADGRLPRSRQHPAPAVVSPTGNVITRQAALCGAPVLVGEMVI